MYVRAPSVVVNFYALSLRRFALRWGMTSLDSLPTRFDYDPVKNKKIKATTSYIDGTEWLYFDPNAKQMLKAQSRVSLRVLRLSPQLQHKTNTRFSCSQPNTRRRS